MKPAILSESGAHAEWIAQPLLDAGFHLTTCALAEVPSLLAGGKYNVLLLGRFYTLRKTRTQEDLILDDLRREVARFLARGGGVYFTLPIGGVMPHDQLLQDYGARILPLSLDQDDQCVTEGGNEHGEFIRYAYTQDVAPEVAAGVTGIWYPARMGHKMATQAVHTADDLGWQPLLRGSPASRTTSDLVGSGNAGITPDASLPRYAESVPIMVGRPVGPGRLAVCGIPSGYYLDAPHRYLLAKRFLQDGFDGRQSDLGRLFLNTVSWLAAPSVAAGTLGGASSSPHVLLPNVPRYPDDPPVRWATRTFPPDDPAPLRGLIGARTSLSTGSGTVADYVARAKAHGLDFIVFLEEGAHLTDESFAALKAECEAASSDSFFAVPGFTMDDVADSHFFQYGYTIHLPRPDLLTPDRARFAPAAVPTGRNGNLLSVHCTYTFEPQGLAARGRRGRYAFADCRTLFEDQRFCDSIAVVTWQRGQIVDDVRERYRDLEANHLRYNPTVLTFMDSPAELDEAVASGWRNIVIEPYASMPEQVLRKHMAPELEWWGMLDEQRIRSPRYRFDNWQYGPPSQYVTQGPEIRAWTASVTSRDPSWRAPDTEIPPVADPFRVDALGYRLRLRVTSIRGLAEVRLYDGQRLLRHWQCHGKPEFEQELDLLHAQQMHLLLEARDLDGHTATSLDYPTLRLDWCEFTCADRNNLLSIGFGKDEQGLAAGWSGTLYLTYSIGPWGGSWRQVGRWWYSGDALSPVPHDPVHDNVTPSDGGVNNPGGSLHILPQLPALDPPEYELMITSMPRLICPDVAINDLSADHGYDPAWPFFFGRENCCFGCFPAQPTRYLTVTRRATVFRPRPHALTCLVHDYQLALKQELTLSAPMPIGWLDRDAHHRLHQLDGNVIELPGDADTDLTLAWQQGEHIVSWSDGRRPAIFFNDGPDLLLVRDTSSQPGVMRRTHPQRGLVTVQLPVVALPTAAVPTALRFIAVGGGYEMQDPTIGEKVRDAMGLAGKPAWTVELESGSLVSQRLCLEMDAHGSGIAGSISQADLPMALPVLVHGLNPNWPVVLVDRSSHRWRPLGAVEGTAYAMVDTLRQAQNLFIGHPLIASENDIVINLTPISDSTWSLELHNPTLHELSLSVTPSPYFPFIAWDGGDFVIPAGASQIISLPQTEGALQAK